MMERRIDIDGTKVRYLEVGAGPPVVFAAGLGISADFYVPNMHALAQAGFRAITPDVPGWGKTKGRKFGSTVEQISDHLLAFAHAIHVHRAVWIGHSIGCQAVLHLAAEHPELARALVLSGPTGGDGRRLLHQIGALSIATVTEPWRLVKAVLRDYVRLSPLNYLGTWVKAAGDDPVRVARAVKCPALVLLGTRDRVPGKMFITELAEALEVVRIQRLPCGQHGLPMDAQVDFDRAVVAFLREVYP